MRAGCVADALCVDDDGLDDGQEVGWDLILRLVEQVDEFSECAVSMFRLFHGPHRSSLLLTHWSPLVGFASSSRF